jgi:hypothetical protein
MPWPKVKAVVRSDLADWDSIVRAAIAFAEASADVDPLREEKWPYTQ